MLKKNVTRYGIIAKIFHWTIALLIIGMLCFGYLMEGHAQVSLHKEIGLLVLTLAALRLIWTLLNPRPKLPAGNPKWDTFIARLCQVLLYVCMFGMPLSGWAMATAFGFPPQVFGVTVSMPGIPVDHYWAELFETIHGTTAVVLIVLISLHVLGALKHHFIDKDDVLKKMLR